VPARAEQGLRAASPLPHPPARPRRARPGSRRAGRATWGARVRAPRGFAAARRAAGRRRVARSQKAIDHQSNCSMPGASPAPRRRRCQAWIGMLSSPIHLGLSNNTQKTLS